MLKCYLKLHVAMTNILFINVASVVLDLRNCIENCLLLAVMKLWIVSDTVIQKDRIYKKYWKQCFQVLDIL
jgi:hypothetical protein